MNKKIKWQPIETAPTDEGSRAIITDGNIVVEAIYYRGFGTWNYLEQLKFGDVTIAGDGTGEQTCTFSFLEIEPTHWMPLPEAPTKG